MSPRKKVDETEYFSVHLILYSFGDGDMSGSRKVKVRFQISLVDPDGKSNKQAGSPTMNVCEFKRLSVWGYDKFITTTELFNPVRRLVEDDTVKIHCRVWIEGDLKHTMGLGGMAKETQSAEEVKLRRMDLLSQDMKSVLDSGDFADVALSTKTKTFLAHKSVLAARSRVFQAMFHAEMVESKQNAVEISDFEDDVVKAMLEYMYSGETPSLSEKAPDLMQIAEKYELMGLKEDCEHAIAANLTIENAAEVLVLAHLHSANKLKPKVIEFINRNKEEVCETEAFTQVAQSNAAVFVDLYLSQK
jgi:speckle-type POZ protein